MDLKRVSGIFESEKENKQRDFDKLTGVKLHSLIGLRNKSRILEPILNKISQKSIELEIKKQDQSFWFN